MVYYIFINTQTRGDMKDYTNIRVSKDTNDKVNQIRINMGKKVIHTVTNNEVVSKLADDELSKEL